MPRNHFASVFIKTFSATTTKSVVFFLYFAHIPYTEPTKYLGFIFTGNHKKNKDNTTSDVNVL